MIKITSCTYMKIFYTGWRDGFTVTPIALVEDQSSVPSTTQLTTLSLSNPGNLAPSFGLLEDCIHT